MNSNQVLFDTNIILYFLGGNFVVQKIVRDSIPYISFITQIELLSNPHMSKTEEKSINQILEYISLIEYNSQIGKIAIDIRKKNKLKVADAIIAATSLFLDVPLATADKEFEKVDNLNLLLIEI